MLFNSLQFLVFFPVVTFLYFVVPHKYRWLMLFLASCYFYTAYVPQYLLILFFLIIVDYAAGIFIEKSKGAKRKLILTISIISNVGILCFFKYFTYIIDNANTVLQQVGERNFALPHLNILLPIGLSFHTFQAISYTIEVYKGKQKAEKHLGIYALYIMFYPQLLAGPIETPQNLLPQFYQPKNFDSDRIIVGLKIMLFGFIKKVVIADRLGSIVNDVYQNSSNVGSMNLLLTVLIFFPFQIYCDFSGYSSIALGAAKVMGFELTDNFKTPYFSVTLTEFWSRWHISLNNWFRNYIYKPVALRLRTLGKVSILIAVFITFILSGVWHGVGWTFVIFGVIQAIVITVELLFKIKSAELSKSYLRKAAGIIITCSLIAVSLVFFRSANLHQSIDVFKRLFWKTSYKASDIYSDKFNLVAYSIAISFVLLTMLFEKYSARILLNKNQTLTKDVFITATMVLILLCFGVFNSLSFIYFQF
jgi:alginate O-acetyltransferase complex protein AlgI